MTSVLLLNTANEKAAIGWVAERGADLVLLNEVNRVERPGRVAPEYLTGARQPGRNMARETGIGTRLPVFGHQWDRISENAGEEFERLAPDRYAQMLHTRLSGVDIDVYCVHLNAGPNALRGKDPNHPIVREYRQSLRWLRSELRGSMARGREFLVGGDVNLRENDDVPWSPYEVFRGFDMGWFNSGLDVLAFSSGLRLKDRKVFDKEKVHSDHPGLGANLTVKGN